jgi:hypothetical protein
MMKRLAIIISVILGAYIGITAGVYVSLPSEVQAQTNTFCAANLACTVTGIWSLGTYGTTGTGTHSGTETFTGQMQCKDFEAVKCVDSANSQGWAGADIGAWINAAYAALPSTGGEINIYNLGMACMNFTTPIVLSTSGKYPLLIGHGTTTGAASPLGGACLNFTPTTGIAITGDYVPTTTNSYASQHGLRNIALVNNNCSTIGSCGGTAFGISWGTTNWGMSNATFDQVAIIGFQFAYNNANVNDIPGVTWVNPLLQYNGIAFTNATNTNNDFIGGFITANGTGFKNTAVIGSEYTFDQTVFSTNIGPLFDFTSNTTKAYVTCTACHFEDFPTASANSPHYFIGLADIRLYGGVMLTDQTVGIQDDFIALTGNSFLEIHGLSLTSGGKTFTQAFSLTTPTRGNVQVSNVSPTQIPTILGGTGAAFSSLTVISLSNPSAYQTNILTVPAIAAPSGVAAAGVAGCYADSTANVMKCSYNNGSFFPIPQTIASGTAAMTTAGILTGACGTTVTVAATGVLTTDVIDVTRNAAATIGNGGGLTLNAWPTAGNVNFNYCNSSGGTITPTAMTINWRVAR